MKQLTLFLTILYWVAMFLCCYYTIKPLEDYSGMAKSLTMPFLLCAFLFQCRDSKHKTSRTLLSSALFFYFLGDVFNFESVAVMQLNLNNGTTLKILSLFFYLTTPVFYLFFFFRLTPFKAARRGFKIITIACIVIYLTLFLAPVMPAVFRENLEVPFILGAIFIGAMLFSAINTVNGGRIKKLAYFYFIPGAFLYVLSNSLHVMWLYNPHSITEDLIVLLTYAVAQFLIVRGAMRFLRK